MHGHAAVKQGALRVGFDYWPAATHAPGVGRYVRELVRALAELDDGPELALLDVGPAGELLPEGALDLPGAKRKLLRRRWRARRGWLELAERALQIRAETWLGRLDVFHRARALGAPHARASEVVALAEFPELGGPQHSLQRAALADMAAVLVFSTAARREALSRFGLDESRVVIVPVGCDHWLRDLPSAPTPRTRARILVLGAARADAGQLEVLRAFERLRTRGLDADLVFCGRRSDGADRLADALRSSPRRIDVRWIDEPIESEMPALVSSASVLVQLAREAWTPVTPLEACAHGAAVVVSRLECFVEALGDQAEYVEAEPGGPLDLGLDEALERTLATRCGAQAVEARRLHARRFTWQANARATLEVYTRSAHPHG